MVSAETIRQALQNCGKPGCTCGRPGGNVHCPGHEDHTPSLSVTEKNGKILVHCHGGCSKDRVIGALKERGLWPSGNGNGTQAGPQAVKPRTPRTYTLQDFSHDKDISPDFLKKHHVSEHKDNFGNIEVRFHYLDEKKTLISIRRRIARSGDKFRWRKGDKLLIYGLWGLAAIQKAGWCLIVEGESDLLTAWLHKIPALAIPGKGTWRPEWALHLQGLQVYLWQEPDAPELPGKVGKDLPGLLVIPAPAGFKDISEAHLKGQDVAALIADLKAQAQAQARPQARPPAPATDEPEPVKKIPWIGHKYFTERGRLCLETYEKKTGLPLTCYLANFQARITEEITRDDGLRAVKEFLVKGSLDTGRPLPPAQIQAREFDSLSWVRREWGAAASQAPGRSLGPHLVNAIQAHSQTLKRRKVYGHSGWRQIGGPWRYLHGGGAIGGGDQVEVDLGENLQLYRLPAPGGLEAAQASLRFLDIGPWEITAPLISCAYLAPFADLLRVDFSLWIYGPTGSLKSTLAALALSHFGNFSRTTLPGSWFSTVNSLEKLCFTMKDSLVVIDDFIPAANSRESQKMGESAARLIYQAGNRSARGRLAADLTARPNYYPRGLIISTGEMLLPGQRQSATARYLGIELDPKRTPIDKARLTEAQGEAHLYPAAMAAYLANLAPRLEDVQEELRALWEAYRSAFQSTAHLRIPEIQAWLAVGFEYFLRFQTRMGAISEGQAYEMLNQAWKVFEALGEKHSRIIEGQRPTLKFMAVLHELFLQGRIYAESASMAGAPPPRGFGWDDMQPAHNAELVGWFDGETKTLYLMPETALRVVNEAIRRQGDFLALGRNEMLAALAREGFIVPGKDKSTRLKWIQGTARRVIFMPLSKLGHEGGEVET